MLRLLPLARAFRRLRRSPRTTLAAFACIGIGTAATTAALTLVSATLLRPLPYPDADRLMRVWLRATGARGRDARIELSYPDLVDLTGVTSFVDLEATARARLQFRAPAGARRVEGEAVTAGYFDLLGVHPLFGRLFTAEEQRPGGERVILLAQRTWERIFGGDESALGRTVRTDRGPYTVVGVLPASFSGSVEEDSGDIEFWLPIDDYLDAARRSRRDVRGIWALGKLAPGRTPADLDAELAALTARLRVIAPDEVARRAFFAEPVGENWRAGLRHGSFLLLVVSALLLLVAALDVTVLLLARAIDERRAIAIRRSLGAGRRRIVGAVLFEALLLVGLGNVVGLAGGPLLLRTLLHRSHLSDRSILGIPVFVDLSIDLRAALLCGGVLLAAALVAGLVPAFFAARTEPARLLREGGHRSFGSRRTRRSTAALIFAEVCVTMLLLVGTSLLLRSFRSLGREDLGFRTRDVLRIGLFASADDVPEDGDLPGFYERIRHDLEKQPGVERVGVVWPTIPIDWPFEEALTVPGASGEEPAGGVTTGIFVADPAFFDAVDIPIVAGRGFRPADGPDGAPVALVNRSLARRIAPSGDPERAVGLDVRLGDEPLRIVGVVADARFGGPRQATPSLAQLYLPFRQSPERLMSLTIATRGRPESLIGPLRRRLADLAPASALDWVGPVDRWVGDLYLLDARFQLELVALFAGASLLLAALGLFAALADAVARRRGELGLRQALGATPAALVRSIVREGLVLVGIGVGAGCALAVVAGRLLRSFLFGVGPGDPWSYLAAAGTLLGAALLASLLPAARAAAVDPATALRDE